MYKVPAKYLRSITQELKNYIPIINSLLAKGKSSTEEDARILLNDMLHNVLGYNKFQELKTEVRDKSGRIDYVIKLTDGPFKNRPDRFDFVVEAKACSVELNQVVIDQTLKYCLTAALDFFVITNAQKWQLFRVKRQGTPTATKIHEVNLVSSTNIESLAEEFYLLSKSAYLNGDWKKVSEVKAATKVEDVVAVILSDKSLKLIARELSNEHEVRVTDETVKEILESKVLKQWSGEFNKRLLKKLNEKPVKKSSEEIQPEAEEVVNSESDTNEPGSEIKLDTEEVA